MATYQLMQVIGGEKGYVPVYDNSHGGVKVGQITNGDPAYWITSEQEEEGYVQIRLQFASSTGENWIEKSHLQLPVQPKEKEVVFLGLYKKNGEWVIRVREL